MAMGERVIASLVLNFLETWVHHGTVRAWLYEHMPRSAATC